MAYEFRQLRRYKARKNSDNSDNLLTVAVVADGAKVLCADDTADTAKITVYAPGSSTAIETDTAGTMTTGEANVTFALDTSADTTNYTTREGYRGDLTITIGGQVYTGHVVFDVVPYVLKLLISRDQLLDRDDRLRGMDWAGDDDMSGIIEACRDELQLRLEGVAYENGRILEDMALDHNKLAVFQRLYTLEAIFRAKGDEDAADVYERKFNDAWDVYLAQVKFDTSQSGTEDTKPTRLVRQRLYT